MEEHRGFKFIRLKSGRVLSFFNALDEAERAHTALSTALSRAFKLVNDDRELGDYDLERLEWLIDRLDTHIRAIRKEIERRRGVKDQQERIALLRNTTGRTPEEAEAYQRKADQLEAKLRS